MLPPVYASFLLYNSMPPIMPFLYAISAPTSTLPQLRTSMSLLSGHRLIIFPLLLFVTEDWMNGVLSG